MDEVGNPFTDFERIKPENIAVVEPDDEGKITTLMDKMAQPDQARALATEYIQYKHAVRLYDECYKTVYKLYGGAKETAVVLTNMLNKTVTFHWDMLQYS